NKKEIKLKKETGWDEGAAAARMSPTDTLVRLSWPGQEKYEIVKWLARQSKNILRRSDRYGTGCEKWICFNLMRFAIVFGLLLAQILCPHKGDCLPIGVLQASLHFRL
ncbi:uncharacterized protein PITG_22652, partial [Phytophthora infestans T30-4]